MPPSNREGHDPFTTSSTTAQSLRSQPSQTSLRSNATAASSRPRQQGNLFASNLSRRPTSKSTPRMGDHVLPDSDSEQEQIMARHARVQLRKARHASPAEARQVKTRHQHREEPEMVHRQADGSYFLGDPILTQKSIFPMTLEEQIQISAEESFSKITREYFATGSHMPKSETRRSRTADERFEHEWPELWAHTREQVLQDLEDRAWQYEQPYSGLP